MTWVKLDDQFAEHAKVYPLSDRAFRLHVTALCYCARNLTDGRIDERGLRTVAITAKLRRVAPYAAELVEARLWAVRRDGHEIRDYLDYNPASAQVKEDREAARSRMREVRANKRRTTGERSGSPARPDSEPSAVAVTTNGSGKPTRNSTGFQIPEDLTQAMP